MEKAGKTMWNDIVKANCARARSTASRLQSRAHMPSPHAAHSAPSLARPAWRRLGQMRAKRRATRKGGIPSGSLEVLGKVEEEFDGYGSSRGVFPADFAKYFNCFVAFKTLAGAPDLPAPRQVIEFAMFSSGRETVDASALEQIGKLLAGIEHPRFHRALGNADDLADFLDRLLMIVDEVDDLAMRRRQFCHAGAQDLARVRTIQRGFRRIGLIGDLAHFLLVDVFETPLTQRGQRLEARDRQQPGRHLGAAFELARGAPHIQEDLADEVFGHGGIAHDAQDEAVNPYVVAGVENVHGRAVAVGDALKKHLIRGRLSSDDALACCGVEGDDVLHDRLPVTPLGAALRYRKLLMSQGFQTSARKEKNGFMRGRIVSSWPWPRNRRGEIVNIFNARKIGWIGGRGTPGGSPEWLVWRFRSPRHLCCDFVMRTSEPKPHQNQ